MAKEKLTPEDVHRAADKANISWDDDKDFMKASKRLTGEMHLDDMSESDLSTMLCKIKNDPNYFKSEAHFAPGRFGLKSKNEKGEPEFDFFRRNHDYEGDYLDKIERRLKRLSKTLKKRKHKQESKELDSMIKSLKPKDKK